MYHVKSCLPKRCHVCRKWHRIWYNYEKSKTGEVIVLCKMCHLVIMCSPLIEKIKT